MPGTPGGPTAPGGPGLPLGPRGPWIPIGPIGPRCPIGPGIPAPRPRLRHSSCPPVRLSCSCACVFCDSGAVCPGCHPPLPPGLPVPPHPQATDGSRRTRCIPDTLL
eukprot:2835675-Rhodomonas_salina.1